MDAINSYVYRGPKPQPLGIPAPRKIQTAVGERLSTILESGERNSKRSSTNSNLTHLPWSRSQVYGEPPLESAEKSPPGYDPRGSDFAMPHDEDIEQPSAGVFTRLGQRGGLKRLALIIIAVIVVIGIALGVGLGVGLNKSSSSSSSSNDSGGGSSSTGTTTQTTPSGPFPVGAYALEPFLTNVSTACTSDSSTWSCFPYTTYSSDASGSEASFDWIITQSSSSSSSSSFLISSSNNPLAVYFSNATLSLIDANTPQERYTFSVPNIVKNVIPSVSLSNDGSRSTCFYNSTTLRASLYTRMNATLTDSDGASPTPTPLSMDANSEGLTFNQTWPGAIMIEQVASGGENVPNCYRLENGRAVGDRISLATEGSGQQCSCVYENYS